MRRQIQFSSTSSRHLETKWKNMDLIRSIVTEPLRAKRIQKRRQREGRDRDRGHRDQEEDKEPTHQTALPG